MTPGEGEEARAEVARAARALAEARLLLDANSLEGAASRLYYAAFHAARAALLVRGRSSRTHSGQIALFTKTYEPTPLLGRLLDLRARADYELGELVVGRETLAELVEETAGFIRRCEQIVIEIVNRGPDERDPPPDN